MPSIPSELRSEVKRAAPVLIAIPVIVLALWGVGVLVMHSRIDDWDLTAVQWLADRRTPWLNRASAWATYIAETIPVIVILLLAIVLARRWTHGWRTSVFLACIVGGEKLSYLVSSILVGRARPPVESLEDTYATSAFPSGHVASAIVLYGGIAIAVGAWRGRRAFVPLMVMTIVFASVVAFVRMYRGFHYPSDCIAGALLGVVWMMFSVRAIRPLPAKPAVVPQTSTAEAAATATALGQPPVADPAV